MTNFTNSFTPNKPGLSVRNNNQILFVKQVLIGLFLLLGVYCNLSVASVAQEVQTPAGPPTPFSKTQASARQISYASFSTSGTSVPSHRANTIASSSITASSESSGDTNLVTQLAEMNLASAGSWISSWFSGSSSSATPPTAVASTGGPLQQLGSYLGIEIDWSTLPNWIQGGLQYLIDNLVTPLVQVMTRLLVQYNYNPDVSVGTDNFSQNIQLLASWVRYLAGDLLLIFFILSIWRHWADASTKGSSMMGAVGKLLLAAGLTLAWPTIYHYVILISNSLTQYLVDKNVLDANAIATGLVKAITDIITKKVPLDFSGSIIGSPAAAAAGGSVPPVLQIFATLLLVLSLGLGIISSIFVFFTMKIIQVVIIIAAYIFAPFFFCMLASPDTSSTPASFIRVFVETCFWTFVWTVFLILFVFALKSPDGAADAAGAVAAGTSNPWFTLFLELGILQAMVQTPGYLARGKISEGGQLLETAALLKWGKSLIGPWGMAAVGLGLGLGGGLGGGGAVAAAGGAAASGAAGGGAVAGASGALLGSGPALASFGSSGRAVAAVAMSALGGIGFAGLGGGRSDNRGLGGGPADGNDNPGGGSGGGSAGGSGGGLDDGGFSGFGGGGFSGRGGGGTTGGGGSAGGSGNLTGGGSTGSSGGFGGRGSGNFGGNLSGGSGGGPAGGGNGNLGGGSGGGPAGGGNGSLGGGSGGGPAGGVNRLGAIVTSPMGSTLSPNSVGGSNSSWGGNSPNRLTSSMSLTPGTLDGFSEQNASSWHNQRSSNTMTAGSLGMLGLIQSSNLVPRENVENPGVNAIGLDNAGNIQSLRYRAGASGAEIGQLSAVGALATVPYKNDRGNVNAQAALATNKAVKDARGTNAPVLSNMPSATANGRTLEGINNTSPGAENAKARIEGSLAYLQGTRGNAYTEFLEQKFGGKISDDMRAMLAHTNQNPVSVIQDLGNMGMNVIPTTTAIASHPSIISMSDSGQAQAIPAAMQLVNTHLSEMGINPSDPGIWDNSNIHSAAAHSVVRGLNAPQIRAAHAISNVAGINAVTPQFVNKIIAAPRHGESTQAYERVVLESLGRSQQFMGRGPMFNARTNFS